MTTALLPRRLRQRFLTALVYRHPQGLTSAEVQAKIFILTRGNEFAATRLYNFFYYQGRYSSFECHLDLRGLTAQGFLHCHAGRYIAPEPLPLPPSWQRALDEFMFLENPRLPGDSLSEYIQAHFPDNPVTQTAQEAIFTIGYEGRSFDSYVQHLLTHEIKVLVDVRYNPYSQKPLFSRAPLSAYLEHVKIDYRHVKNLGIPGSLRKAGISRTALFAQYQRDLAKFPGDLSLVQELLLQQENLALTCFERDPEHCHRNCLSSRLAQSPARPIVHIV